MNNLFMEMNVKSPRRIILKKAYFRTLTMIVFVTCIFHSDELSRSSLSQLINTNSPVVDKLAR